MADRPRNQALAAFLTLAALGVGQVYNGEWRKAVVLNGIGLALFILVLVLVQSPAFALVLPVALIGGVGLLVFALVDAVLGSRKRSESYELKSYNRVLVYVAIIVVASLEREFATQSLREGWVQAFRIPSEAMMPTLLVGDHLFVDKRASARTPGRGDVVVFRYPEEPSRFYIKRVVAVGGDEVEVRDKVLYVNGQPREESLIQHIDPSVHPREYDPRDNFDLYTVPKGSYFVMGDNRDNSNDSRFWGPVDGSLVQGKALGIYWSWDAEKDGPRWERVGTRVP
jgi:signal peptidase I